jgi:membrane fusion protein, multidrug efflux system
MEIKMKKIHTLPLFGLVFLWACVQKQETPNSKGGKGPPAFPVEVETVSRERVEYVVSTVGSVDAFEIVAVTARVAGVVDKVNFKEGQLVKEGQTLVEIDPARYSLAVSASAASKEKAAAALADAQSGLARREGMAVKSLVTTEEVETWQTKVRAAAADVDAAKASTSQASLNLRDARVKAPLSGTVETRTVSTGQYVQPGTVLATMLQRDPLLLRFKVTDAEAPRLTLGMPVQFTIAGDLTPRTSLISAISGKASADSRLVDVVAEVPKENNETLRPGSFAELKIVIGAQEAPVIPETAVRPSAKGFLAFVIVDGVAQERVLQLGMRTNEGKIEVLSGLKSGETLVVRGAEALRTGSKVKVSSGKDNQSSSQSSVPKGT